MRGGHDRDWSADKERRTTWEGESKICRRGLNIYSRGSSKIKTIFGSPVTSIFAWGARLTNLRGDVRVRKLT